MVQEYLAGLLFRRSSIKITSVCCVFKKEPFAFLMLNKAATCRSTNSGMLANACRYFILLPFIATMPIKDNTNEARMHNHKEKAVLLTKKLITVIKKPRPSIINRGGRSVIKPKYIRLGSALFYAVPKNGPTVFKISEVRADPPCTLHFQRFSAAYFFIV